MMNCHRIFPRREKCVGLYSTILIRSPVSLNVHQKYAKENEATTTNNKQTNHFNKERRKKITIIHLKNQSFHLVVNKVIRFQIRTANMLFISVV